MGHAGKLVAGLAGGVPVAVLAGRAHIYEGYSARDVVYGIRTLDLLGVNTVVALTYAAGGINVRITNLKVISGF